MRYKNKVFIVSLGILLLAALIGFVADPPGGGPNAYSGIGYMLLLMIVVVIETFVLFVMGIIANSRIYSNNTDANELNKQKSKAYFLAMGLVLLVGVSLCFGGPTLIYG